jgi:isocitrate dehydrogenase kinase/phosphatase
MIRPVDLAPDIAATIRAGFDKHYGIFRETSAAAKDRFERGDWAAVRAANKARIQMYDQRVREAVEIVAERFPNARVDETLWPRIKLAYIGELYEHKQPECAETFFNSVACRVLHRRYYRNEYLFWRPAVSTEHLIGTPPAIRSYYRDERGVRGLLRDLIASFELRSPWQDLERDLLRLEVALREDAPEAWREIEPDFQVQILGSLFFRNKGAYAVGRARNGFREHPFVVPIVRDAEGRLAIDAVLTTSADIARVFSLARAYFMVDVEVPAEYVAFLSSILPTKSKAELYTMLGLQKQGKTLFYRDLHQHLVQSTDRFVIAPGTKGMVMVVFTLPSFPYVFKVIRDWFPPPKDVDREKVEEKYLQVKYHDRAGRMADTLEYSHVAFPRDRFDPALIDELVSLAKSQVELEGDQIVVKHLYIERRMTPLDIWLDNKDEKQVREAIREYGQAIRELAAANIFAGDFLLKNFGITRHGRIVFYDYDEIGELTEFKFRRIPAPSSHEDEMSAEPYYSVGAHDVFPEQLPTFLFGEAWHREIFVEEHGDLCAPRFWIDTQRAILRGEHADIFPYRDVLRFHRRFA